MSRGHYRAFKARALVLRAREVWFPHNYRYS